MPQQQNQEEQQPPVESVKDHTHTDTDTPIKGPNSGGRKRKTRRRGKKSKKKRTKRTKRTKAGKTKRTRTSLNSPIISRHARSLRHRSPIFTGSSLTFKRKRK